MVAMAAWRKVNPEPVVGEVAETVPVEVAAD